MLNVSKAVRLSAALLMTSTVAFSDEGGQVLDISNYAHIACEVHSTTIQMVITTNSHTPSGSRISITGANSIQTSLTPNSRLGFQLARSELPLKIVVTTPEQMTQFSLDQDCQFIIPTEINR